MFPKLEDFLEGKGIKVEEIECLTSHPDARTKAFRVAIAIADYEKALDPEVWPYRVAVRPFRPARKDRDQKSLDFQFGRSGGVIHQHAQVHHHHQAHQAQVSQVQLAHAQLQQAHRTQQHEQQAHQEVAVLELSNRYEALAEMNTKDN